MDLPLTLIGFMSSGKTTIGRQLAAKKGSSFIDLDEYIVQKTGRSIPSIFKKEGEQKFREIENQCLMEVLAIPGLVVALGGGTPCFYDNLEFIKSHSTSVYLQVSAENLARRLEHSPAKRPLLRGKSREVLLAYIKNELEKREVFYLQADYVMQSDNIQVDDILNLVFS